LALRWRPSPASIRGDGDLSLLGAFKGTILARNRRNLANIELLAAPQTDPEAVQRSLRNDLQMMAHRFGGNTQ
jgi:hypothetical protein